MKLSEIKRLQFEDALQRCKGTAQQHVEERFQMNETIDMSSNTKVFVDMDGVVADFFGEWTKLVGEEHWTDIEDDNAALDQIRQETDFWTRLRKFNDVNQLIQTVTRLFGEYYILSTPLPGDPKSVPGKIKWVRSHLRPAPEDIFLQGNKEEYAVNQDGTPNILIDDFPENHKKWEAAGGIAIKHQGDRGHMSRTTRTLQDFITKQQQAQQDAQSNIGSPT